MKKYIALITLVLTFGALTAFGQDATPVPPSSQEILSFFSQLSSVGGLKGAAIIVLSIQGLMLFFRSSLSNFAGKWKLAIISGLSFFGAFIAVLSTGEPVLAAMLNGAVLAAFQVFANQLVKQFATEKGQEKANPFA